MHAESSRRWWRTLTIVIPFLALTGCGEGDGQPSIAGKAADPLPVLPAGFCDSINFEIFCDLPAIINFNGGATVIVENPDPSGINQNDEIGGVLLNKVARMQKFPDRTFGGTRFNPADVPVDFSAGKVFKIKVWSPREVRVLFKLEESNDGSGGVSKEVSHSGSGTWEELCFDFSSGTVNTIGLTIIFDNGDLGFADVLPDDWTFYYDDITQAESCVPKDVTGIVPDVKLYDPAATPPIPVDVEVTAFDSQSVIEPEYAEDDTYSRVLAVSSGVGDDANVAQIGFVGGDRGFASDYESLDFKVKGMPNNIIFVKLFDAVDSLRLNLTSSAYSAELDNGWYQVSIPITAFNGISLATGIVFESDNTAPMQFTMLLNDVGFTEGEGGGDGGNGGDQSITPDFVLFGTTAAQDVAFPDFVQDVAGPQNFGSGATFAFDFADTTFDPVIAVTAGDGYSSPPDAPNIWVAFLAVNGYAAGFTDGFDTFNVKVKGSPDGNVEVKFIGAPGEGTDSFVIVNVNTYAGSADLGDGWYQLSIPFSQFSNPSNIPLHNGWLVGPPGDQADAAFVFLMTDVGFSDSTGGGDGGGDGAGTTPDFVLYGTTAAQDVAFPDFVQDVAGPQNFGSGATFAFDFADTTFDPVIAVTAGDGYSNPPDAPNIWVAFLAVNGYAAGFADGFDTFNVKVKGSPDGNVEVKFLGAPGENTDSVATVNVTTYAGSTDLGDGWYQLNIPYSEFSNPGNIPQHNGWLVGPPGDQADAAFVFLMTDVGFSSAGGGNGNGGGVVVEGNIAINGGFETGAFNDGSENASWQQFPGGGTQTIVTDNPSEGTYAAKLSIPVVGPGGGPVDNLIKNANLQAGSLTPNAPVTVTWDVRGSLDGISGVIFVELFSELAEGGTSKAEIYTGGPISPDADANVWTSYTWNTTLGDDVQGGVTVQLKVGCGGVEGCGADIYFDNVTIVVD